MRKVMKISAKIAEMVFIKFIVSIIKYPFRVYRNKEYKNMLLKDTNKEKFSEIYSKNFWSSKESGSGKGSEIIYTKNLRCWLLEALPANGVEKFVDAACGDFNWMKLVIPQLHVEYYGIDIVDSVIEKNIAKYSDEKTKFAVADICNDKLPDCDLIMIRDCLFHLSFSTSLPVLGKLTSKINCR